MSGDDPDRQPGSRVLTDAAWTWLLVGVSFVIAFVSLMWLGPSPAPQNDTTAPGHSAQATQPVVTPEMVSLATGDEPLPQLFKQAGCPVCHMIPGIDAGGHLGPRLVLSKTGPERLGDPNYRGQAKTVREYIIESILNPGIYIVPGYPALAMPRWYGKKLSAAAVDRIAGYLEQQTEGDTEGGNR
jgi:hypothetical protein